MRAHLRVVAALGVLGLAWITGCSADPENGLGSDSANHTEVGPLTLDNVFLEHAHPAYWEPGDPRFVFPVAARNFYGFRPFDDVEIALTGPCLGNVGVQSAGEGYDALITLWCVPDGDESRAFAFTTASYNYGQEEEAFDIVRGTSFEFVESVTLEQLDAHHYLLHVLPPEPAPNE